MLKNQDGRINFRLYLINQESGWGYEVYNKHTNETLKRDYGFKDIEDARLAGLEEAKRIINEEEDKDE